MDPSIIPVSKEEMDAVMQFVKTIDAVHVFGVLLVLGVVVCGQTAFYAIRQWSRVRPPSKAEMTKERDALVRQYTRRGMSRRRAILKANRRILRRYGKVWHRP